MKWLLLFLLTMPHLALAQGGASLEDDVEPAIAQIVPYQRQLPTAIVKRMGSETKSLFWGRFIPKGTKAPVYLHLYNLWSDGHPALSFGINQSNYIHLCLDIWDSATTKQPKLLSRVFISCFNFSDKFGVRFYWLDPKTRKIPFLVVKTFDTHYDNFPIGEEHLVVFPHGWRGAYSVQSLNFGPSHSSDLGGQQNIVFVNSDGTLSIRVKQLPARGDISRDEELKRFHFTYYWNEYGFYPKGSTDFFEYGSQIMKSNGG